MSRRKRPKLDQFDTRVVHAGEGADPRTGAVMPPLYWTSTYRRKGLDDTSEWSYGRTINPTRRALETAMAQLEGGAGARAFASGMAAASAVLSLLHSGDRIAASRDIYGGSWRLLEGPAKRQGIVVDWVDMTDIDAVKRAMDHEPHQVWLETPSNPTLRLIDLRKVSRIARKAGALTVVDNTFMTPAGQQPLADGADLVLHSTTKYLNGHSDGVGGCVVSRDSELDLALAEIQKTVGAILGPTDAYLVIRGIKTLALRMERHAENALAIAKLLQRHPKVQQVNYPGLPQHPQHALAKRRLRHFGGVVSFDLGRRAAAKRFFSKLRLFTLAESLGGVESLANHPATMTHAALSEKERQSLGVTPGLVRLSVGIEAIDDLKAELRQALG